MPCHWRRRLRTIPRDQVDELQKETDRLHTRITFCFFTLILIAAGLLSRAGYKLYHWSRPMNPYKRELRSSLTEDPDTTLMTASFIPGVQLTRLCVKDDQNKH